MGCGKKLWRQSILKGDRSPLLRKQNGSHFWKGILGTKEVFLQTHCKKSIGVGARFWKDFLGAAIAPCLKKIKRLFSSILQ